MTSLNLLVERGEICKCLRAKSMYYDAAGEDPSGENEDSMWCAHTQSILGPDGQVVDVRHCCPGRSCCETT